MNDHFKSAFKEYKQKHSCWLTALKEMIETNKPPVVNQIASNLSEAEAFALEIETIAKYGRRGIDNGGTLYNRHQGGFGSAATKFENIKAKLIELNKSRGIQVSQIDSSGNLIGIWASAGEAQRQTGLSRGGILDAAKRKDKLFGNFFWRFTGDEEFHGITDTSQYTKSDARRRNNHASKKLIQIEPSTNSIVHTWDSMSEAIRAFPKSHARAFDNAIKNKTEYRNFYWSQRKLIRQ